MVAEFTIGLRRTQEVSLMVAVSMTMEGTGAALFAWAFLLGSRAGIIVALALLCAGAIALFADLGHPLKFWRVASRASRSWISRGALFIASLVVLGILYLLLPDDAVVGLAIATLALLCALVVMLYPGLLFSSMASVPFWHTAWLPILFVVNSLTSAAVIVLAVPPLAGESAAFPPKLVAVAAALALFSLILAILYVRMSWTSIAAQESVRLLTSGRLRTLFVGWAILVGLVIPLVIVIAALALPPRSDVLLIAAAAALLLRVIGDVSFRHAVLSAGVFQPVIW